MKCADSAISVYLVDDQAMIRAAFRSLSGCRLRAAPCCGTLPVTRIQT